MPPYTNIEWVGPAVDGILAHRSSRSLRIRAIDRSPPGPQGEGLLAIAPKSLAYFWRGAFVTIVTVRLLLNGFKR